MSEEGCVRGPIRPWTCILRIKERIKASVYVFSLLFQRASFAASLCEAPPGHLFLLEITVFGMTKSLLNEAKRYYILEPRSTLAAAVFGSLFSRTGVSP